MKLIYISSIYHPDYLAYFKSNSNNLLQNAAEVFQNAIYDGLCQNNINFHLISLPSLPAYPIRYNKLMTPQAKFIHNTKDVGTMLSFCNLLVYKTLSMRINLYRYLSKWFKENCRKDEKVVILTYTPYPPFIKALKKLKKQYPNCVVSSIITDLVDDMFFFAENRKILKRIQAWLEIRDTKKLYNVIDKYILLTKNMEEKIPESISRNIIVEGIYSGTANDTPSNEYKDKVVLYSGSLDEFSGVKDLVDAFMLTNNKDFQLVICGKGFLENYIKKMALLDRRIIFLGQVERNRVIDLQYKAKALINPRSPGHSITKYSFPSKTMEYLASGTPMIGYKLEGIPNEYYTYMYTVDKLSIEELSRKISEVLLLPQEVLYAKGLSAKRFILENKTAKIQVNRIVDFIYN